MEQFLSGGDHDVGDELLERRIFLGLSTRHKEVIAGFEKNRKVPLDLGIQAVERPDLVKKGAADDKDFLWGLFGHREKRLLG